MSSVEQLFTPEDAKLLVKGTAFTLNAIAAYLNEWGRSDTSTAQIAEMQMYNLVGSCTRFTTDQSMQSIRQQFKNALYDIVQNCLKSFGQKNKLLLEYLKTICDDADDKRTTSGYGTATLLLAAIVVDMFLRITTRSKEEIQSMNKNDWLIYKHLLVMRLTLMEEWQKTLSNLGERCQNAVRTGSGDDESKDVKALRVLFRQVDADHLLGVKVEAV